MVSSISDNGGRSCINASAVVVTESTARKSPTQSRSGSDRSADRE
jgi:hypothetical protein